MEVVPVSVGTTSRGWDEQHLDLAAASGQIGDSPVWGFTMPVLSAAVRFTSAWQRHTTEVGTSCEAQADGLRAAIRDYIETDQASFFDYAALLAFVDEAR